MPRDIMVGIPGMQRQFPENISQPRGNLENDTQVTRQPGWRNQSQPALHFSTFCRRSPSPRKHERHRRRNEQPHPPETSSMGWYRPSQSGQTGQRAATLSQAAGPDHHSHGGPAAASGRCLSASSMASMTPGAATEPSGRQDSADYSDLIQKGG